MSAEYNCSECQWWRNQDLEDDEYGECLRHSPITEGGIRVDFPVETAVWPMTHCESYCGDFHPR